MGIPENEVAADNQRREFEDLAKTPGGKIVTGVKNVISLVPGAGPIANAIGLSKIMMELGASSVEENVKYLGSATAEALARVERRIDAQGVSVQEIADRYSSPEFAASLEAAILQTQRTRQRARLNRLALILANSVEAGEIEPDTIDDLARAAVELTEWDIQLLNDVRECESTYTEASGYLFMWWQEYWRNFTVRHPHRSLRAAAGSLGRLQSFGFIYGAEGTSLAASPVSVLYRLSEDGERFLKRIDALRD
ncbi:hypothetical protein [Terriglobus albidus]|uniref:hypothetical protein n=1 Tax=Terriglobus albidus TaxID=1592106 RepID=UPI0021DF978F|nr:hypothetical protein [Terriglobus albidus]